MCETEMLYLMLYNALIIQLLRDRSRLISTRVSITVLIKYWYLLKIVQQIRDERYMIRKYNAM